MTEFKFANNASGTLSVAIGGASVSLTLGSGEGSAFPALSSGEGFYILISEGSKSEWVLCGTHAAGSDTLSGLIRDANPESFTDAATVKLMLNATILESFLQAGAERTVTSDPDGSLAAQYSGEEVYNTDTEIWWKHCTGTTWKAMHE